MDLVKLLKTIFSKENWYLGGLIVTLVLFIILDILFFSKF
jgi:hypothetical protein